VTNASQARWFVAASHKAKFCAFLRSFESGYQTKLFGQEMFDLFSICFALCSIGLDDWAW